MHGPLTILSPLLLIGFLIDHWSLNRATPRSHCLDVDGRVMPMSDWWLWQEVLDSRHGDVECSRWASPQPLWPAGKPLYPSSRSRTSVCRVLSCRTWQVQSPAQNLYVNTEKASVSKVLYTILSSFRVIYWICTEFFSVLSCLSMVMFNINTILKGCKAHVLGLSDLALKLNHNLF